MVCKGILGRRRSDFLVIYRKLASAIGTFKSPIAKFQAVLEREKICKNFRKRIFLQLVQFPLPMVFCVQKLNKWPFVEEILFFYCNNHIGFLKNRNFYYDLKNLNMLLRQNSPKK
jgi:hypothetical protein